MNMKHYMSYADLVSLGNASFGFLSIIMVLNGYLGNCCTVYVSCSDLRLT